MAFRARPYQNQAIRGVWSALKNHASTLVVSPTGSGKTVLFSILAEQWDGPVLVLAHRKELLQQAKKKLQAQCREPVGIDQGQERAAPWGSRLLGCERVICGSVQTLVKASRRKHYDPSMPWLVIVDEAHHATATSYKSVLAHFSGNPLSKVVGVTATPKRTDKQGLISAFESAAFVYPIREAIEDGWLVDVEMLRPKVTDLDFSKVGLANGDLDANQIADIAMQERPLHEVAAVMKREVGLRQGIVFCANRPHVAAMTAVLQRDRYFGESRVAGADGETDPDVRDRLIARFQGGDLQILVNCGLFIEGLDVPAASWLGMCRPTKSLVIYTQALGRIMRPLEGVVDIEGWGADDRKAAIGSSAKPQGLLLDFCGIAGRHKLVDAVDVLHADKPAEVREAVRKVVKDAQQPLSFDQAAHRAALEEQLLREQLEWRKRQEVVAEATYEVHSLGTIAGNDGRSVGSRRGKGATGDKVVAPGDKPTDKQVRYLRYLGVGMDEIRTYSKKKAGAVIDSITKRQRSETR
jgi:superfamily II DNA or RNA helicase